MASGYANSWQNNSNIEPLNTFITEQRRKNRERGLFIAQLSEDPNRLKEMLSKRPGLVKELTEEGKMRKTGKCQECGGPCYRIEIDFGVLRYEFHSWTGCIKLGCFPLDHSITGFENDII